MRIGIIDTAASLGGAQSILFDLYRFAHDEGIDDFWVFFVGDIELPESHNIKVVKVLSAKKNWIGRLKFDWITGAKFIQSFQLDIVINMQNTLVERLKTPQFLYIHQSIPFQHIKRFSFLKRKERIYAVYQYGVGALIKKSAQKAMGVFVQTQWMKGAVSKYRNSESIFVLSPEIRLSNNIVNNDLDTRTFFYPANKIVYKNHEIILESAKTLIKEGYVDFRIIFTIERGEAFRESPPQIHYVGSLPREDVMSLYHSSVLIFPSYIETYGLPLAEARMSGGVVFAADTDFSREILDKYSNAYFFDPFNPDELTELMRRAIKRDLTIDFSEVKQDVRGNSWKEMVNIAKDLRQ